MTRTDPHSPPPPAALDAINAEDLLRRIAVLSADAFGGRSPGSQGEELCDAFPRWHAGGEFSRGREASA